ncbi:MAG: hypothetical protein LBI60_00580 [Bacteroidales bacterium]|jgi:hypothetical protein|nr:hypothetical protein [Bacteroidales bacterium]
MNLIKDKPIFNATDTVVFSICERDGITGVGDNLVFIHISDKESNIELKSKHYIKQLQDITEDEAKAIIISHCYGARQMLEVAGFSHLIKDMDELD